MIEVRCFHSLAEAAHLRDAVNALNLASERPCPFSTFEFFENFLRHDESPDRGASRPWFLAAFENGALSGYLALKQEDDTVFGLRASRLGFLVSHSTDRPHAVASAAALPAVVAAFYAYLGTRAHEWDLLEFQQQDATSALFTPPAAYALRGHRLRVWPSLENGTIPLHWNSLADYFHALPSPSRSNVSRQMRLLFAAGTVESLTSRDPATLPALFELCRSIEPLSWKANSGAALARHPERLAYYQGLMDPAQPMKLSIQVLLLDGLPVTGLILGHFNHNAYALHLVFDERHRALGPGSAALFMGLRQAIEGRCDFVNLLSGFGYYKSRWLAKLTPTHTAQIYRGGSLRFFHRELGDLRRRWLAGTSATLPVLFNPARRSATAPASTAGTGTHAADRERISALIAATRSGAGEFLGGPALEALMPFPTRRPASRAPAPLRAAPVPGFPAH